MELNNKAKIILIVIGFVLFAVFMFLFGYSIIGSRNKDAADEIGKRKVELEVLQREQKSFEQGKIDLAELSKSAYPPDELFSRDTKVVKEIQQLESIAQKYGLKMTLSVAGTTDQANKVPLTTSELYSIPYKITLTGDFTNTLMFIQTAERLPFITHAQNISVSADSELKTRSVISSNFYLKK